MLTPSQEIKVEFSTANTLATEIINALQAKEAQTAAAAMACALVICRIFTVMENLSDEKEIKFIEDLMDWVNAYFTASEVKN